MAPRVKIPIRYRCPGCADVEARVDVESRREGEGVVAWFKDAVAIVTLHHELRKGPKCRAEKLTDLKVPLTKRDGGNLGEWTAEDAADYATKFPAP